MVHIVDNLISAKTGEVFARVDVTNSDDEKYWYSGTILTNQFPLDYLEAVSEFHTMVEEMTFSLSDGIERRIYSHEVVISDLNLLVHQVLIDGSHISFFIKYPSGKGFLDDLPYSKEVKPM